MSEKKKILHGAKIRIHPDDNQARQFDSWRVKTTKLWNLLLGMQQAAYSGEKFRPELGWRKIWADIAQLNYSLAMEKREAKIAEGKVVGDPPKPPQIDKILPRRRLEGQPNLFIWENDLMKLMARLKQVPLTGWIGDIHSHAAQAVCKDMIKALKAMFNPNMDAGFPKFKKASAYAEGSVYFANTQIKVDRERRRIKFPLGVGEIKCGQFNHIPAGSKLMGGRIFRIGEEWWLSAQFEIDAPAHLPRTGKEAGVKVAAKAVYTVYDGENFEQVMTRQTRLGIKRRENLAARKLSRRERRSGHYYEAASRVAQFHADERNRRDDTLHKGSRAIVNAYDTITIDKMDVKSMMAGEVKVLRKYLRGAAMSRAADLIKYKAEEAGRVVNESHVHFPSTQICANCGTVNPQMANGTRLLNCIGCGNKMQRQKNAAMNEFEQGQRSREATLILNRASA